MWSIYRRAAPSQEFSIDWHRGDLEGEHAVVYHPGEDARTGFYVLARDLGEDLGDDITEADLPHLHEGIVEGLRQLPACRIHSQKEINKESAIGFEFVITFALDGEAYKRKMRLLYRGRHQFTIYGQGVPPAQYDALESIFDRMYLTFTFGDVPESTRQLHLDRPGSPRNAA